MQTAAIEAKAEEGTASVIHVSPGTDALVIGRQIQSTVAMKA